MEAWESDLAQEGSPTRGGGTRRRCSERTTGRAKRSAWLTPLERSRTGGSIVLLRARKRRSPLLQQFLFEPLERFRQSGAEGLVVDHILDPGLGRSHGGT